VTLVSVQRFAVPEIGFDRTFYGIFHPRIWLHIVALRGAVTEERLVRALGAARPTKGRRLLALCIDGDSHVSQPIDRSFSAGHALVCNGRSTLAGSTDARVLPSLTMNIDWDAAYFGSSPDGPVATTKLAAPERVRAHVLSLASAIARAWDDPRALPIVSARASTLLRALRADGFETPRIEPADLVDEVYRALQPVSSALDRALSTVGERAARCDVEGAVDLSSRTTQRRLASVVTAWGYADASFRDVRRLTTLFRACALMTNGRATTELGARVTGFSTPTAFCRAFHERGLPSPGNVRDFVAYAR